MNTFLHFLLQNTLAGSAFLAAVLLFRKASGNLSKLYVRLLWLLALAVLLLPPMALGSPHTVRDLFLNVPYAFSEEPDAQSMRQSQEDAGTVAVQPASGAKEHSLSTSGEKSASAENPSSADGAQGFSGQGETPEGRDYLPGSPDHARKSGGLSRTQTLTRGASAVLTGALFALWALGALSAAAIYLLQWRRLRKSVAAALKIRPDVWCSDQIDTPFVMPGLPARIYVPKGLEEHTGQFEDILLHERRHIKNHDPLIKCAALPALLFHWFNPLVWISMRCMNRDMEMYCDECVLDTADTEQKQHYAQTLLDFACQRSGFLPALYFGESTTKSRIVHILNVRRPRRPVKLLLLLLILVCGFSFLTTGSARGDSTNTSSEKQLPGGGVSYRAGDSTQTDGKDGASDSAGSPGQSGRASHAADRSDAGASDAAWAGNDGSISGSPADAADAAQTGNDSSGTSESEEFWADQRIVGTGHPGMEPGFDLTEKADLLDRSAHFALYGFRDEDAIVVEAPDGCLIYARVPYTSTYDVPPVLLEHDFDGDRKNELAIITWVMHGTGVSIRSLFMTDQTADGSWNLFHYRDSDYTSELMPHFGTRYDSDGVRLLFDGAPTGIVEQVASEELDNQYGYYAGSQIDFRFVEKKIVLRAKLAGYSKINNTGEFPGHELDAEVRYLGEGRWELSNIHYADAYINDLIEEAIPFYLSGQIGVINESYTVPGLSLKAPAQTCETVTILSVSYFAETLENNRAEVHVTLRPDASKAPMHLSVPVKRVPLDFGGMWWRIAGEITIL